MFRQKNKKNGTNIFGSYLFLVVITIVASMVTFSYVRTYYQDYQISQEINQLENEAKKLESKKLELIEKLDYVKTTDFIAQKARTDLNMIKTDEKMMIVPMVNKAVEVGNGQENNTVVEFINTNNYKKWWDLFMSN